MCRYNRPHYHGAAKKMSFSQFLRQPYPAVTRFRSDRGVEYTRGNGEGIRDMNRVEAFMSKVTKERVRGRDGRGGRDGDRDQMDDDMDSGDDAFDREHPDTENFANGCRMHSVSPTDMCLCATGQSCAEPLPRGCNPGFRNPVQLWNIKMASFLALDTFLPHVHLLRYHSLLEDPPGVLTAMVHAHCLSWARPCFKDSINNRAPNIPRNAHADHTAVAAWGTSNRADLKSHYIGDGWIRFWNASDPRRSDLAFLNSELDPTAMRKLGYEYHRS